MQSESTMPRQAATAIRLVLLDIEGTVTPFSFVQHELFAYARSRLADFLRSHAGDPEIAEALRSLAAVAPGAPPLETLLALMDHDARLGALKTIQDRIWEQGYGRGDLTSRLYPEVGALLRAWHRAGILLATYCSASVFAQRLLFSHGMDGDLTGLFTQYFDTSIGSKRESTSYATISRQLRQEPGQILFLSDADAKLDAARNAGLKTCQIARPEDGTIETVRHESAADLVAVERHFGIAEPYSD